MADRSSNPAISKKQVWFYSPLRLKVKVRVSQSEPSVAKSWIWNKFAICPQSSGSKNINWKVRSELILVIIAKIENELSQFLPAVYFLQIQTFLFYLIREGFKKNKKRKVGIFHLWLAGVYSGSPFSNLKKNAQSAWNCLNNHSKTTCFSPIMDPLPCLFSTKSSLLM